MALVVSLQRNY